MKFNLLVRTTILLLLVALTASLPVPQPLHAQDAPAPIELDQVGFGVAKVDTLAPQAQAEFALDLKAGDRVTMDLQGETDALQVTAFAAPYGPLVMEGMSEAFNYLAWAPEDGTYTIAVENTGDTAAGFTLRVVVTPAPLPTKKILTLDANGETIPIAVDEAFQVALDTGGDASFPWQLDPYDTAVVSEAGGSVMVPLGTMPGAMSQEIFTFVGIAPGETALTFNNERAGDGQAATFSVTIEVTAAGAEGAAEPLALDATGVAQATGALEPQGMASYVVDIGAGTAVRADVWPKEPTQSANSFVLTVVGADGNPLQTDHAGASTFDQTLPVSQAYTFKVINFGDKAQEYTFALAVSAPVAGDDELGAQLVRIFFDTLLTGDKEQVAALLAPAFQLVRGDGTVFDAASYPDNFAVYETYAVSNLHVTRNGDLIVVAYMAQTDTTMDGGKADFGAAAPRLTVFQQIDGEWKLLAHANFGPPAPTPASEPAASDPSSGQRGGIRNVISTDKAPAPIGPYSQAMQANQFIYTSGQLGVDPATGNLAEGVEAQTRQALANLEAILAAAGASPADVVKTTLYLTDINDFDAVNAIYGEVYKDAPPARSTVQVAALPKGGRVEIEVVALLPEK